MFENFLSHFSIDGEADVSDASSFGMDGLSSLMAHSFDNGLYKVYDLKTSKIWTDIVVKVFHQYKDHVECFGCDWQGRQFALDKDRVEDGQPQILMFHVGNGQVYEIPANIIEFHNKILVEMPEPTVEKSLYKSWIAAGNSPPKGSQCVGYKVPPFMGGEDKLKNLFMTDMQVEWQITAQLLEINFNLPAGSRVDSVTMQLR